MDNKASITALMSAFVRAYHTENADAPVFSDNVARRLFSDEEYEQMGGYIVVGADFFAPKLKGGDFSREDILEYIVNTQLAPTPAARAKFCEDSLKTAVMTGVSQYVILGAGYDTFAWREPELMKKLDVFEADHPLTQEDKRSRLRRAGLDIPQKLRFVPLDFTADSLKDKLLESGFDMTKKTFFSWLGVTYYLTEEQIRSTLSEIASLASEGSEIVFDFADDGLFCSNILRVKNMLAMAQSGGEPMKFCCRPDHIVKLLEDCGFLVYEELSPDDIDSQILGNSVLSAFEHIHYIKAVIKNTGRINTREKILRTALRLFSLRGYDAVSVRDISRELGITQAALYKHFKSKQDIFDTIYDKAAALYDKNSVFMKNNAEPPKDFTVEQLIEQTKAQMKFSLHDPSISQYRRLLTIEQYRNDEMRAIQTQRSYTDILEYHKSLFRRLMDSGVLAEGDEEVMALQYFAPVSQLLFLCDREPWREGEAMELLEKHIRQFFMMYRK